jgi:hypothetical protein
MPKAGLVDTKRKILLVTVVAGLCVGAVLSLGIAGWVLAGHGAHH